MGVVSTRQTELEVNTNKVNMFRCDVHKGNNIYLQDKEILLEERAS